MMNEATAVQTLREMYNAASDRHEKSIVPLLFGIEHAELLADYRFQALEQLARQATGYPSYGGAIREGVRLAQYVKLR